jgi:hypothetical protein
MKTINDKLVAIQGRLKAPKNQRNSFGNYNYRSAEDIQEAVKPLLQEFNLSLTLDDEIKEIVGVPYTEATAIISDGKDTIPKKAQAGINLNKKGMDIAQSFGASSSYARKYALSGLFLLDDTKDADATNDHKGDSNNKAWLNKGTPQFTNAKKAIKSGQFSLANIREKYNVSKEVAELLQS